MNQEQIHKEIEGLLYVMKLKRVTRFGFERPEHDPCESVADHVYGLHVLARYFLPLVDANKEMDHALIYDMILWHDTGEIETGDIPTFHKTSEDTLSEIEALSVVKSQVPTSLAEQLYNAAYHYETGEGKEVEFMGMLDKLESALEVLSDQITAKMRFEKQGVTKEMFLAKRKQFSKQFPLMYQFAEEIADQLWEMETFCDQ